MPVRRTVLAALLVSAIASGARAAEPLRDLDVRGTPLRAACVPEAWRAAVAALHGASAGRDTAVLATTVRALLCGEGRADSALVQRAAPARLVQVSEGTGEPRQRVRVDAAEALQPLAGAAWDLQVRAAAAGDVQVSWQANEACVRGLRLRHRPATGWRIVELSSACD